MNRFMRGLSAVLWIMLSFVLAVILYLSFQDGESAKDIDNIVIRSLAEWYYNRDDFNILEMMDITYRFRQFGRIVLFMGLGLLGTSAVHTSFYKIPWIFRTIIAGLCLMAIAIFTERYKIYLPTRHFSETEMMYSIYGVLTGFFIISVVSLVLSIIGRIFELIFYREE